ncbi:serine/threonine-protein kinase [Phycicoccus sp. SLBN-51]|uniref:serine/threonine-protein kinase n=1 Tax=Phycicoccus sp. SLBN-51 TaxID=2768447 RepID=UPI0011720FEC|nr:serine/threonine-protein kinase [Phycicoccus sp. SLBN-51]TQJ48844.1 serine/threonine protein kinase [Phycicoccus sp. SLBN-51]
MSTAVPPEIPGLVYVQPVGSGGYADVFLYEQQMPRMPVAVKVLKGEGLTPAIRQQFTDEADTMAQLGDHPYIVQVFRADTAADGRPYLVMKYYPPPNLAVRARRERFTVEEVLRTGIQLASAVETAHRAGIIHRDIKPANVLVSQYGAPGLTDFGIAGQLGHHGGVGNDVDGDDDGDDVGVSVPWAPPEVLFGQSNGDERADVYSLAATLWQLLVGRSPFEVPGGDNTAYALMPRIRSTPVPATGRADVPVSLERLLALAMAKDPSARPASALQLARALQAVEQEQRFARTAIVVLDEQGQTTLADHSGPRPEDGDDDRTRVRAPKAVQAQAPAPARPSPPADPAPLSGSTTIPAAGRVTPHTGTSTAAPNDDLADEGTVRVDRSRARQAAGSTGNIAPAPGEAPTSGTDERPQATISPAVVLGVVGVLVLALVGVGAWALAGRGGEATPTPTPSAPTLSGPSDDAALDVPQTPELEARALAGGVRFAWSYPGAQKADTFRLRVAPTTDALAEATFQRPKSASQTIRTGKGRQLCAQVQVLRSGASSVWSEPACEKAG